MSPEIQLLVKVEIEKLLNFDFIRSAKYSNWLSSVVPVTKKNRKIRVCVDFRNLNLATSKDKYPMVVADLPVDGVTKHEILLFMDAPSQ